MYAFTDIEIISLQLNAKTSISSGKRSRNAVYRLFIKNNDLPDENLLLAKSCFDKNV
jgi:hypothetical protein